MKYKKIMVEIWGDVVEIKDLLISIAFSSVFTIVSYFLAPSNNKTRELFYGMLGAVIGFIISTILIKPKRIIIEENKTEDRE